VVHTYNPSYLGSKDHGSKPSLGIVWETLSQKYPARKRAGGVVQVVE
jgi:hypothetical protein